MFLRVPIGGHEAVWRFRDSAAFSAWLRAETWRESGGVFGVRLRSQEQAGLFISELERELAALRRGRVDVRVLSRRAGGPIPGLREVLSERAGLAANLKRGEWIALVAQETSAVEVLYVVDAVTDPSGVARWREEASEIVSELRKACDSAAVTVLVLAKSAGVSGAFDFSIGEPLPDLGWLHQATAVAWQAYMHRRIAWETGGDLALALSWSEVLAGQVGEGDDQGLETWLNTQATDKWKRVPVLVADALKEYLLESSSLIARDSGQLRRATTVFEQERVFWRPHGAPRARLVPWVARALLLAGVAPQASVLLRSELSVPGVVGLAFSRCLELEGWVRAGLHPVGNPKDDTLAMHERLCQGVAAASAYYLPAFPAPPRDVWWVASFGEVLYSAPAPKAVKDSLFALLNLRNALGHGHPCCWAALMALRRLEEQLG